MSRGYGGRERRPPCGKPTDGFHQGREIRRRFGRLEQATLHGGVRSETTSAVQDTADVEVVLTCGLERAVINNVVHLEVQNGRARVGQTKLVNEFVDPIAVGPCGEQTARIVRKMFDQFLMKTEARKMGQTMSKAVNYPPIGPADGRVMEFKPVSGLREDPGLFQIGHGLRDGLQCPREWVVSDVDFPGAAAKEYYLYSSN